VIPQRCEQYLIETPAPWPTSIYFNRPLRFGHLSTYGECLGKKLVATLRARALFRRSHATTRPECDQLNLAKVYQLNTIFGL
jgi:hypothetical protein